MEAGGCGERLASREQPGDGVPASPGSELLLELCLVGVLRARTARGRWRVRRGDWRRGSERPSPVACRSISTRRSAAVTLDACLTGRY